MLRQIDPLIDCRWDKFIINHPEGLIFHHSAWMRVLIDKYGEKHKYFILENKNGEITGIAPFFNLKGILYGNQFICLPNTDTCFPLANDQKGYNELLNEIMQEIIQNKSVYAQIKGCSKFALPQGCNIYPGKNYLLVQTVDLKRDFRTIRAGMTRNGRYNLRLAEKQSFSIKFGQDEKDLRLFYKMLVNTLQKNNAFPPEYTFLRSIFRNLINNNFGCILFAEDNGKIVAGNMYLCFKKSALCKYSAQINKYSESRPNYFLHWKAIEHFYNQSFSSYDFGATDPNDQGLLFFKRNWGIKETKRSFYYYPEETVSKLLSLGKPFKKTYGNMIRVIPEGMLAALSSAINKYLY